VAVAQSDQLTEPITRWLLIWCLQLLTTLKICTTNHFVQLSLLTCHEVSLFCVVKCFNPKHPSYNLCQPSAWPPFKFLNCVRIQIIIKQIIFTAFLSYKLQIKTTLFGMNLFMHIRSVAILSLYLHSLAYISLQLFWFSQVLVFFKIHYRTKAVVCQNILKATVQCTTVEPTQ